MTEFVTGKRMQGKVALVTGGSSGFGRAIALRFASEGCKVLVGDLNEEGANETVQKMGSHAGEGAVLQMDVTKEEHWQKAVKKIISDWGRIDCVVNNAGWSYKNKPTLEVTESDFERCFAINVKSIFLSVGAVVPEMKKTGGGCMINISSIGSSRPRAGLVWYNSSKGAVSNATKGLAAEYGPDQIRVNAICPLLSGTGLFESFVGVPFTQENVAKFVGAVPLGRLTDPTDVANAALFLASDEGKFCTGVLLDVDGGKTIS